MATLSAQDAVKLFAAMQEQARALLAQTGIYATNSSIDQFNALVEASEPHTVVKVPKLATNAKSMDLLGALAFAIAALELPASADSASLDDSLLDDAVRELAVAPSEQASTTPGHPRVFIGCSVEGISVAKILQLNLRYSTKTDIWAQGVFGLSGGTLETLVGKTGDYDFAILVLTPDDVQFKRGAEGHVARDNVIFELGLFIGALGRNRVFIVTEDGVDLPSDLAGITTAGFTREGPNLVANLGPVTTMLELEMGVI